MFFYCVLILVANFRWVCLIHSTYFNVYKMWSKVASIQNLSKFVCTEKKKLYFCCCKFNYKAGELSAHIEPVLFSRNVLNRLNQSWIKPIQSHASQSVVLQFFYCIVLWSYTKREILKLLSNTVNSLIYLADFFNIIWRQPIGSQRNLW